MGESTSQQRCLRRASRGLHLKSLVKTTIKAGRIGWNHNETLVQDKMKARGRTVRTHVKAGALGRNHNETLVRDGAKSIEAK